MCNDCFWVLAQFIPAPMRIVLKLKERMMDLVSESVCLMERERERVMEEVHQLDLFCLQSLIRLVEMYLH